MTEKKIPRQLARSTRVAARDDNKKDKKEVKKTDPQILDSIKSGMVIKVHQKIKETNIKGETKERIQVYEGMVIARRHGKQKNATVTVRKISEGIGVEKIFPIYSPIIAKIEIVKEYNVRRAKLNFLKKPHAKLKERKRRDNSVPNGRQA